MNKKNNLVIIGSGLAGYMLAKEWRKLDQQTELTIITASDGSFYSKPLLSTALTNQKTADSLVVADVNSMARDLNATILTHTSVIAIDAVQQQVILADQSIDFGRLVLACGADMIRLALAGDAANSVASVNDLMAYRQFRQWLQSKRHIAILGTGLVGCEFANDLINAEHHVTLISPDQHPLATLVPKAVGTLLQQAFSSLGINWRLQRFATAVNHAVTMPGAYEIELENGDKVYADGVFSAVGLRPNLRLAQSAGLRVNRGIMVNRYLRSSHANIYALGDCAEVDGVVKQYVAPILQCARALAATLTGNEQAVHYPVMPIVIKTPACPLVAYPPEVGIIGEWHIEGEDSHLRALFHDQQGQLQGYVLVGDKIRDKVGLAKQLPLVFA